MLKIMISNASNEEDKAKRAVQGILDSTQRYDWPNTDLAYVQDICYRCGESYWTTMKASDSGVEHPNCPNKEKES